MRVAVIGAGVSGLVCAMRLAERGADVRVYERWPGLGGQAATLDVGDGVRLERYYHYLFTSDSSMIALFEELGLSDDLERHASDSAVAVDGRIWPFNGAMDLLRFRPIPLVTRLRMGLGAVRLQLSRKGVEHYEDVTACEWITRHMGRRAWDGVWGPLMRGKFGERAEDISMAWIWDKICRRRSLKEGEATQESFLYPRRTFEPLFEALVARIEAAGGRVMIDRPAARIERTGGCLAVVPAVRDSFRRGLDPRAFDADGPPEPADAVVCCVPNDVFLGLLSPELCDEVGPDYLGRVDRIEYFTALNLLLELDRPLTDHFWVNVADRSVPFVGLIEHTNLVGPQATDGRAFTHVTNYLPAGHPLLDLGPDELLDAYEEGLARVVPDWSRDRVRNRWMFREPAGQPIVTVGYPELIPPRATGAEGLWLVNTTQIYPEDRGTNYAVRDGELVAGEVLASGVGQAARPGVISS